MMGAVHPKASVGVDGAPFRKFLAWLGEAVRNPPRFALIDFSRKEGPVAQSERFEALKSVAASGHAGCMAARKELKRATNAGLAKYLRRELPEVLR